MNQPSVIVLAGPNGAGKSTAAPALLRGRLAVDAFVNADAIARGLSGFAPETVAMQAGRIMLARLKTLAAARDDFAFETTLASRSFAPWLKSLVADGYRFHLVFLWLPSADLAVARVADRVRQGGHDVPEETIRRRYAAGIQNFTRLYRPIATSWQLYNAETSSRLLVAHGTGPKVDEVRRPKIWRLIEQGTGGSGR
ncbi:MAG: zeta toxin family protein [Paludisphaera borealis]|uniref:AAA family ATPase n=1 Tax=Paludisphaera borealis TaxID=1387353 RepID=UPI00283E6DA6|nr:AAA family ATPase [Paludisphaera borealis]MDR3622782.1 zeta toxin family protein [Paludisphaera borealis]